MLTQTFRILGLAHTYLSWGNKPDNVNNTHAKGYLFNHLYFALLLINFIKNYICENITPLDTWMKKLCQGQITSINILFNDGKSTREILKIVTSCKATVENYPKNVSFEVPLYKSG